MACIRKSMSPQQEAPRISCCFPRLSAADCMCPLIFERLAYGSQESDDQMIHGPFAKTRLEEGRAVLSTHRHDAVPPPWRQPRGKWMVSLVNSHTNATSKKWHLWEIDLRFALNSTAGWCMHACNASQRDVPLIETSSHDSGAASLAKGPAAEAARGAVLHRHRGGARRQLARPAGPVDPSFRALSERLKFTVRRHKFNKYSLSRSSTASWSTRSRDRATSSQPSRSGSSSCTRSVPHPPPNHQQCDVNYIEIRRDR